MKYSQTLSIYIVKNLLINLFYVFIAFCFISFILELLELIRKIQGKEILVIQIFKIVLYKIPYLVFSFLPFVFLFGSIITFTKLNNNFEIAAARSAGISIWSFLVPIIGSVIVLSLLILWIFHPISAIFLDKNRIIENKYFDYKSNRVSLNTNGIWLHDQGGENPEDEKFISANNILGEGNSLQNVKVYCAGKDKDFTTNYASKTGNIEDGFLLLKDVIQYVPGAEGSIKGQVILPTSIKLEQIQESIPDPEIIPLWSLSDFIKQIKQSGFSTLKHELYYQTMLVSPIFYVSLVLIALYCSLNLPRNKKLGVAFVYGSIIAIVIYFIEKVVNVMALTGVLPVAMAVASPSIAYLLLSSALLIHCEEE